MPPVKTKKILVTGFGPFGDVLVNPSWQAVSRIEIPSETGDLTKLEIEVTYEAVQNRIPPLTRSHDVVIHVGVAEGTGALRLETEAAGDGYGRPDAKDSILPPEEQKHETFKTAVDVHGLLDYLKPRWKHVEISHDAGRFLCEYIFYTSLSVAAEGTPVLFVHVPSLNTPYSLDEVVDALREIVVWVASS